MQLNPLNNRLPEETEYICKLIYDVVRIPICFMDNVDELYLNFTSSGLTHPLHEDMQAYLLQLFNIQPSTVTPLVRSGEFMENYLEVPLFSEGLYLGRFIIGPCLPYELSTQQIDERMQQAGMPLSRKRLVTAYLNALTLIDYRRLLRVSQMVYYMIYQTPLSYRDPAENSASLQDMDERLNKDLTLEAASRRMQTVFHHTVTHEKELMACIREGDLDRLIKMADRTMDGEEGILSKDNPLRSQKNLAICMVTLATRAAIDGGLASEYAFTLSDLYIQQIETIKDVKNLASLGDRMLLELTRQVRRVRQSGYSQPISKSVQHIHKHLYETHNLETLAETAGLSVHYFSQRFKEEVGFPVMAYVQKEKIEEAARLIRSSDYSILEISNSLGFFDQSHFTKVFKRWMGATPKKYTAR